jgi:alpha-glucosidase/alpha-D-xyloside xylohydrolase
MSFLLRRALLGLGERRAVRQEGLHRPDAEQAERREGDGYSSPRTARAPVQWLVGTDGWAMFIHQPYGAFDFSGAGGKFTPRPNTPLPLDVFVVEGSPSVPCVSTRITGLPEMPPRWALGYLQSSRTLAGPDESSALRNVSREERHAGAHLRHRVHAV